MWCEGEVIRREVLNDERAWTEMPVIVVRDERRRARLRAPRWDDRWAGWRPDPAWPTPEFAEPDGC